ncbi:Triacylglycerol Lipase [Seminavis robusta]|uniref:GPI inositol-deacylase n=1 Tax=Seminavis robusta TaxID=568900 RepID=A0A9N8ECK9_9STRA|nr:Triacylglycerol Lipase [Seminavis robusta]|eukprot:Sro806_g205200.1 Triacylglycerol Lipase (344) ;mRNA; f:46282-47313
MFLSRFLLVWVVAALSAPSFYCQALQLGGIFSSGRNKNQPRNDERKIQAAVLVPGFLTGASEFQSLCDNLTERGLPTVAVPMPAWHWLPCLGGRSARPILERIDFTVQHLIAADGDITKVPSFQYSLKDAWEDFWTNPGGVAQVGGSQRVDEYPIVEPRGTFDLPELPPNAGKIALIGHSAGGWISRAYLSSRSYGGKAYEGSKYIHSLVTLGTPHQSAPGPAFEGVQWCNEEPAPVRSLAVGGTGFKGDEWGAMTQGAYSFCCNQGTDGTSYTGDGMTPIDSALSFDGAEQLAIQNVTHFSWDTFGAEFVAPELAKDYSNGRPWYGSKGIVEKWADWIVQHA